MVVYDTTSAAHVYAQPTTGPFSSVVVFPMWRGRVTVRQRGGACDLWTAACKEVDTPLQTVKSLHSTLTRDPTAESTITHVTQQGAVALWRMDFPETAIQWETQASVKLQWMYHQHYQSDRSGIGHTSKCCRILESGTAQMTAPFLVQRADQYWSRRACLQFSDPPQCRRH